MQEDVFLFNDSGIATAYLTFVGEGQPGRYQAFSVEKFSLTQGALAEVGSFCFPLSATRCVTRSVSFRSTLILGSFRSMRSLSTCVQSSPFC